MADRTHVTTTSSTQVASLAPIHPLPVQWPGIHRGAEDEDLAVMAEDLEVIVDSRRERLRRGFDMVAASAALFVLAPILAAVALAIKFDSPGPVFYTQDRIGINRRRRERRHGTRAIDGRRVVVNAGRPFTIWKFRTMRQDAEAAGPQWASSADPRITRVGRFLRASSLDELPQLFNVLRGEMSLVGPRPLLVQYLERYTPEQARRHAVLPGITGWAQVNGRNAISWEEKFRLDVWYVDHWSLWLDVHILFRTIFVVPAPKDAYYVCYCWLVQR